MEIYEQIVSKRGVWTLKELASLLNIHSGRLYKLIKQARLPVYRLGEEIRLDPTVTAEWVRSRFLTI